MRVLDLAVLTLVPGSLAASIYSDIAASSLSKTASNSTNLGDYIAAGLELTKTSIGTASATVSQATSTATSTAPSTASGSTSSDTFYANTSITGGNTVTTPSTSYFSSCRAATTDSRGQVNQYCVYNSTVIPNTFTNTTWASATDVDECWTEWVSYWSMHTPSPATISVISYSVPETTETIPYLYTEGSHITDKTITSIITSTAPTVADNGGFTQTLSQVVVTYTTVLTDFLSASTTSTSMYTNTYTPWKQNYTLISASNDADWPAPSCTLPPVYPACQSQWDEYVTHNVAPNPQPLSANCEFNFLDDSQSAPPCYASNQLSWATWRSYVDEVTSPVCSQASITGELCTSLKDAYVIGHNYNLAPNIPEPASFSSGYYSNVAPWFTGWTWPATQAFAPGCTLDCGRCAVTGGTIELLYFPPGLSHPATGPVVATTLGTVLTSPTYYISFASLYASDACSGVGSTLTSMIIPIPTSEPLSTLFATTNACDAHLENNAWLGLIDIGTAAFNVSDLLYDSIPYSIYTSQPYCASQIAASGCDPDSCPTTLPYRPLIVLSSQLLNTLDPAWATCSLDLRGLYDPPKALQPATAIVVPTQPGAPATTSAIPASGPPTATPDPTAQPEQEDPSPTQNPADSPAPPPSTIKSPEQEDPGPTETLADPPAPPPSTPKSPDSPSDKTSPAAGATKSSPETPAPIPSHTSDQPISADPAGVIISLIAGTSKDGPSYLVPASDPASAIVSLIAGNLNNGASKQISAADPATSIPGANTIQAPQAQDPQAQDPQTHDSPSSDAGHVADAGPDIFSVGSQAITATPGQPLVVAGSTLSPNAAVTVDGHTYSSGSAGLIVDGTSVVPLPGSGSQASAAVITIGSQVFTASAADPGQPLALLIDGTTLTPGGPIATIGGVAVSAGGAGLVVGGTQTIPLSNLGSASAGASSQAVFTLGSGPITAFLPLGTGNAIIVDGTTLSPGGSAATISGTVVSAGNAGVVIGGTQTIPLSDFGSASVDTASQAFFTLGSSPITALLPSGTGNAIVVDGTTLSPGGSAATIDDTVVSAGSAGLVVGGSQTIPWSNTGSLSIATASQAVITLGSRTVTAILASGTGHAIIVDGTTLWPGASAITVDGTQVSAGTAGLIIGGTRTVSFTATASPSQSSSGRQTSSSADSSAAADPSGTTSTTQSGSQRAFEVHPDWLCVVLASYIALAGVVI